MTDHPSFAVKKTIIPDARTGRDIYVIYTSDVSGVPQVYLLPLS